MLKKYLKQKFNNPEQYFGFKGQIPNDSYSKKIISMAEGNELLSSYLQKDEPYAVGRIGATELGIICNYISNRVNKFSEYKSELVEDIFKLSGVFPNSEKLINRFAEFYLSEIKKMDLLGAWNNLGEDFITDNFYSGRSLIPLRSIEPYYFTEPWSQHLKNKKVLVIHPFASSIEKQYEKRPLIFPNTNILPEFELQTIGAIQSLGKVPPDFKDWFEALNHMKSQIQQKDFEIAIIGAGAYGLPLASYIKGLGKQAIHMGGASQILFGIKGNRWLEHPEISKLFNDSWTFPFSEERPDTHTEVEGSCYW